MNISRKWLKEFVEIEATDKEYADVLTLAGQKVETVTRMDAEIKNVVVGKVLSMARHENSDHMWVCHGRRRPARSRCRSSPARRTSTWAISSPLPGTTADLPGGVHITKGKLRGVASCGMLCS